MLDAKTTTSFPPRCYGPTQAAHPLAKVKYGQIIHVIFTYTALKKGIHLGLSPLL